MVENQAVLDSSPRPSLPASSDVAPAPGLAPGAAPTPSPPPAPGRRLGDYELLERVGAGGMAEVWMARRAVIPGGLQACALKIIHGRVSQDERYQRMFLQEARLALKLRHANVVSVLDAGEAGGRLYMALEWIDGVHLRELAQRVRARRGALPVSVACHVVSELLQGLRHAHGLRVGDQPLGVVHRDVAPHNVLVSSAGEVKLADFGIARVVGERSSGEHVKGRARYMAPEQLHGEPTQASDLFAVGGILHELLDGRRFREGLERMKDWHRVVAEAPLPPLHRPDVPPALEALRVALLQPDPERRIASADEALAWLLRCPPWPAGATTLRQLYARCVGPARRTGLTDPAAVRSIEVPRSRGSAPPEVAVRERGGAPQAPGPASWGGHGSPTPASPQDGHASRSPAPASRSPAPASPWVAPASLQDGHASRSPAPASPWVAPASWAVGTGSPASGERWASAATPAPERWVGPSGSPPGGGWTGATPGSPSPGAAWPAAASRGTPSAAPWAAGTLASTPPRGPRSAAPVPAAPSRPELTATLQRREQAGSWPTPTRSTLAGRPGEGCEAVVIRRRSAPLPPRPPVRLGPWTSRAAAHAGPAKETLRRLSRGLWLVAGMLAALAGGLALAPGRPRLEACIHEAPAAPGERAHVRLRGDDRPLAQVRIDMQTLDVASRSECWLSPGVHELAWRPSAAEPWRPVGSHTLVSAKEHLIRVGEDGLAITAYDP